MVGKALIRTADRSKKAKFNNRVYVFQFLSSHVQDILFVYKFSGQGVFITDANVNSRSQTQTGVNHF